MGIQNEIAIGVTPDPFSPPKTQEKAVYYLWWHLTLDQEGVISYEGKVTT